MFVGLKRISAMLGLLAATAVAPASAQGVAPGPNQATADAVASALRSSPALRGYRIDIEARDGRVTLVGALAHAGQHREAIERARRVAGVSAVVDQLRVTPDPRVQPAQYQPAPGAPGQVVSTYPGQAAGNYVEGPGAMPAAGPMGGMSGPMMDGPMPEGAIGGMPGQPGCAGPGGVGMGGATGVGYPTTNPWQAWTRATPAVPNPEIPYDWRAVTLRWDDGLWWIDFKKHYSRPFFTPYPFQIFAY